MKRKAVGMVEGKGRRKGVLFHSFESLLEDREGVAALLSPAEPCHPANVWGDDGAGDRRLGQRSLPDTAWDEQSVCNEDTLRMASPSDHTEDVETSLDRMDVLAAREAWVRDHARSTLDALYKHDYPSCLFLQHVLSGHPSCSWDLGHFLGCFKQCIDRKKTRHAAIAMELFIEHRVARALCVERQAEVLELLLRLNLDPDYCELLEGLVSLHAFCFQRGDGRDATRLVVDRMASTFAGYPFRAIACGNFLSLCSHEAACCFYDVLLARTGCPQGIVDAFNAELTAGSGDLDGLGERLLLLASKLACTSEAQDEHAMLRAIRQLKGRLPRGISAKKCAVQRVLTRIYGFVVANQQKRPVFDSR